jgi:hypothetical protein
MNPPPLPHNDNPPPLPPQPFPPASPRRKPIKWIVAGIVGVAVIALLIVGGLAATCPDEVQMRNAVYGEMGPQYKTALEWIGRASKLFHGPHLVYRSHVVYSTLDFDKGGGDEIRLASGSAGKITLTPEVKEAKDFILSIPGVDVILKKTASNNR